MVLTIILVLTKLIFATVFVSRLTLTYNLQGSYFDENSCTVYQEQAVLVYGLLFPSCSLLTLLSFYKTKKAFFK